MTRLLALLRDFLAWSVPSEIERGYPTTLAEFQERSRRFRHVTGSPINRRAL